MERIESELACLSDEELCLAAEEHAMLGFNFNETDTVGNESAYYEKFLLDDFDNYLDEINDRLTVSRLVTDSIIKGMVNAVVEETAEKVASKEAEIASLKEKLRASSHIVVAVDSLVPSMVLSEPLQASLDSLMTNSLRGQNYSDKRLEQIYPESLGKTRISVESQIQRIKDDIVCVRSMNYYGVANVCSSNKACRFLPQTRADEKMNLICERVEYLRVILAGIFDEVNDLLSCMKISTMEQQWEHELHEEIRAITIHNFVRDIQEECETKIFEQRKLINTLYTKYEQKVSELSFVREDLDSISNSLLNSDQILLLSPTSSEAFEELSNTKWKDQFPHKALGNNHSPSLSNHGENGVSVMLEPPETRNSMPEFADFPLLKHLSKEDQAAYYKIEMTKMRRQHDKAMEEKTDELFRLKREFLKEKDSLLSKKDKELENVKRNVHRIILKLNDIQTEKEMLSVVKDDYGELCSVKNKINSLFFENQRLQGLLIGKRKEIECLSAQVTDATSQMLLNASENKNLLERIEKLKGDLEDLNLEVGAKETLDSIIWKEFICKHELRMEEAEMETNFIHDIYSVLFEGFTNNAISMINDSIMEKHRDRASFESILLEKESALRSEIEGSNKLKQEITSLSLLISEKEKTVCEADSTIAQQKHFDLVNQEIGLLRDQINKQELIISGNKIQSDLMVSQLDETRQRLYVYELERNNLNQKLAVASCSLEESERQKAILKGIIKERENKLSYSNTKVNNQVRQVAILNQWKKLLEVFLDFESKVTVAIERYESRLRTLSNQCSSLKQQINLLLKKGQWYKRMFEIRNLNMQKAESEVDLLGDEVDALLSVLGKVYVALDHYSPVLQHYPGVMEILKLVRRELQGETTTSR